MAGPVGVEELASCFVDTLVGVSAEVVTLSLQEVCGQCGGGVAVEVCQRGGEGGHGDTCLYGKGYDIEILACYEPSFRFMAEWWKQLYGESEGKENKGIFPASVDFTTDLHSMGQWIQEGERTIFETVLSIEEPNSSLTVPSDEENLDGLNFLAGKHVDGGVPNMRISIPKLNEYYLGQLIYFFEIGCGISGYVLGVNPFNQPGVEAYKKNMFALLDKPGYEEESKAIRARL